MVSQPTAQGEHTQRKNCTLMNSPLTHCRFREKYQCCRLHLNKWLSFSESKFHWAVDRKQLFQSYGVHGTESQTFTLTWRLLCRNKRRCHFHSDKGAKNKITLTDWAATSSVRCYHRLSEGQGGREIEKGREIRRWGTCEGKQKRGEGEQARR